MLIIPGLITLIKLSMALVLSDMVLPPIAGLQKNSKLEWLFKYKVYNAIFLLIISLILTGSICCFILAAGYLFINICKVFWKADKNWKIFFNYILYIGLIVITWMLISNIELHNIFSLFNSLINEVDFWIVLTAYMLVIWPCGVLIGKITEKWRLQIQEDPAECGPIGLESAGRWIGWTERAMILTFIFLGQYMAVGFLVAAKSIFRFDKIRKSGEYYLIGTLISFTLAILIGIVAMIVMNDFHV